MRLIVTQDEERRRIARDLHDSFGQLAGALSMNNGLILTEAEKLKPTTAQALRQNVQFVEHLPRKIRTISHLLHPPLLDEVGLLPAIKPFAEGFGERSKIRVTVGLEDEIDRLAPHVEISIFRIVQECLTNIYRHSGSATAIIKIGTSQDSLLTVEVRDERKGMPAEIGHSASHVKGHGMG